MKSFFRPLHLFHVVILTGLIFSTGFEFSILLHQRHVLSLEQGLATLRLARAAASSARQMTVGIRPLLMALAQLPAVQEQNTAECDQLFADFLKQNSQLTNIFAADASGNLFCSALPHEGPVNASDRLYFQRALQTHDFSVGDYQIGRISKKPTVGFGYPVLNATGQVQAVVGVALDLRWLEYFVTTTDLPIGSVITVIDRNATILARYPDPENLQGQVLPDAPLLKEVLAKHEGTLHRKGLDNIKRLHAFTSFSITPDDGAYVIIGVPN